MENGFVVLPERPNVVKQASGRTFETNGRAEPESSCKLPLPNQARIMNDGE